MMAAIHGGFRVGLGTAGLSGALLAVVTYSQEGEVIRTWPTIVLYLVVSATIAQVRRLLLDLQRSTDEMSATSAASEERLSSLEGAHGLLERLADITGTSDTSPVAVGRLALEMVCSRYPDSGAVAAISSDEGPILVARYGTTPEPSHESTIPLVVGDREVGMVKLRTPDQLAPTETDGLTTSLRPLALAFSNALLLQEITGSAVKAERVRLARELHDDIGPGLASLGLALDLALVQSATDGELTRHVEQLRGRVTEIVDEVRSTVSDLRTGRSEALRSVVDRLIGDMKPTATISFEVDERRPVRPSLAEPVYAVCGEALRNAINHSAAASIRITGWVDFDRGRIVVADDGRGFDPSELPDGHFGVVGMRERAAKADLVLDVSSGDNGTRVLVEWR
jgi:signal transduction histidine kinase